MPEPAHLVDRAPQVAPAELLAGLVPPPQFADATFASYRPDPAHPTQAAALAAMSELATRLVTPPRRGLFRKAPPPPTSRYLDGGYGVGKTHLLAALAHAVGPERSAYGTFVEFTHLVGALGFNQTVAALSQLALVCIDEFELDDPGDTVLMSRLLRELADAGVCLVATSNTLPEALGEGRFAAEDFLREIQALAARFETLRIDGPDYRMRSGRPEQRALSAGELATEFAQFTQGSATPPTNATLDSWPDLLAHIATIHPSRYGRLVADVDAVFLTDATQLDDDMVGLRLVVLVDRLYDRDVPVRLSGTAVAELFSERMLGKGYRKKYLRALSRLGALAARPLPASAAAASPGGGAETS